MPRQCWTCNTEHDLDDPCKQSSMARAERAASGGRNSYLFRNRESFEAKFDGQCTAAGDPIGVGDEIRSDANGGYEHVNCDFDWEIS